MSFGPHPSDCPLHIVAPGENFTVNLSMMFTKPACTARELSDLPNLSFALAAQLRKLGIHSPGALRSVGAEDAWLSVQAAGCPHGMQVLFALEGAILNMDWRALPQPRRNELVRFASTHLEHIPAA